MTSSCLCKNPEGAGFPFQVKALEDGVDDSIHALDVYKAHHGPGTAPNLDEAALDHIGRAQLFPEMPGKAEERQQLWQITLQLPHHAAVLVLPAPAEAAKGGFGLATAVGPIDGLGIFLERVVVAFADLLQDVAILCTQQR